MVVPELRKHARVVSSGSVVLVLVLCTSGCSPLPAPAAPRRTARRTARSPARKPARLTMKQARRTMERWIRTLSNASTSSPVNLKMLPRSSGSHCEGIATRFLVILSPGWRTRWSATSLGRLPFFVAFPQQVPRKANAGPDAEDPPLPDPCLVKLVNDGNRLAMESHRIVPFRRENFRNLRKHRWILRGGCEILSLVSHQKLGEPTDLIHRTIQMASLLAYIEGKLEHLEEYQLRRDFWAPKGHNEKEWRTVTWLAIAGKHYHIRVHAYLMKWPKTKTVTISYKRTIYVLTPRCELRYVEPFELRALRTKPGAKKIPVQPPDTTTRIK